jgi:hypothetical protein
MKMKAVHFIETSTFLNIYRDVTYQKTVTTVITSNLLSGMAILTLCSGIRNNNEVDYNFRNFGIYLLLLGLNFFTPVIRRLAVVTI